ncbi:MAG: NYN domain-containing protein [Boseongicola sp. SB0664_bin_43]|uniref:NYN domain-containing protein n=1 Tax=Boseongicola sp. SB0664_bin_43 TaxID=2604844 RepID=A0A6B0Y4L3_9RHOB|nr:NYN domain-containing protein [Boseongicola sp. SB0664_bin_43]
MRTCTYIHGDGFNLWFGALRRTSWRWLDLVALFRNMLPPHHEVVAVKCFKTGVS